MTATVMAAAACGSGDGADGPAPTTAVTAPVDTASVVTGAGGGTATTIPVSTSSSPPAPPTTVVPATTEAPPTTARPVVDDPPTIANPERPWVAEARDDLVARSGINIEAANCVFDRFEREGFDVRLLVWGDDSTPLEISAFIGLCGSTLTGGFDLPEETRSTAEDYGGDPALDRLWDWCAAGDGAACDELWWQSPSDSAYESFADSCGGRGTSTGDCIDASPASSYGDSELLDLWYDSCADGYGVSCDELHFLDGVRGDYLAFGRSCGDRIPPTEDPDCTEELTAFL